MRSFIYAGAPSRIVFGAGAVSGLAAEVDRLGAKRALVLTTPGRSASVRTSVAGLGERLAGIYDKALMHVPVEVALDARRVAQELGADCCIAWGGGSTIGLGKAIALTSGLPVIAVPTTYSGSEMTAVVGMTEGGEKKTQRDPRMLPRTVIYDAELTRGLSPATSAASGMNAIAHCVEALAAALPRVVAAPADLDARSEALYGAWLAGASFATTSLGLHHKLCHVLGGTFNLPHAETHSIVLPHAISYNHAAAPDAMQRIARALGAADPAVGIYEFEMRLGLRMKLAEIGMPADGLPRAAKMATESPYPNPRPPVYDAVLDLLENAYHGRRPA
jgi:maleylacetate reductase